MSEMEAAASSATWPTEVKEEAKDEVPGGGTNGAYETTEKSPASAEPPVSEAEACQKAFQVGLSLQWLRAETIDEVRRRQDLV